MKKGKKMPSIELEGHSEAHFILKDGKIVKVEGNQPEFHGLDEPRGPGRPG